MCYEVKCSKCGKTTWGGCGRHVPSVYERVAEGQHCMCRDWPGVKLPPASSSADAVITTAAASDGGAAEPHQPASNCAIL